MDDHNDIPKKKLSELLDYTRRTRHPRDLRERPGVHDSIRNSRTTLLINLIIEGLAGVILLVGMGYTVKFLFDRRSHIEPGKFRLYLEVLGFFLIGWLTYFGFKVRAKYFALVRYGKSRESGENHPES